ncbi:MAG: hypothetical protein HYT64_01705 [Candidatus Yanofskybacteria bacterium]|nr:hypothetical protein [Candidatus Yanofskybacteria bacterium]
MEKLPKIEPSQKPTQIEALKNEGVEVGVKKLERRREKRRLRKLEGFDLTKQTKMESLHLALQNLDNGEPVDEFRDETRRILYFDKDTKQYFIEEDGQKKHLGIGDIASDYAWGIKYVPDGEMIEPAYRNIAKKILVNETRRDIEDTYNYELGTRHPQYTISINRVEQFLKNYQKTKGNVQKVELFAMLGILSEVIVRELISRTSANKDLAFVTLRASSLEDAAYKYDFKVRAKNKNRGIDVEGKEPPKDKPMKIGFQLKTHHKTGRVPVKSWHYSKGKKVEVDEILLIDITTEEFNKSIEKWLEQGKPSGGPEQFLSRNLKIALLKAVTKDLVEISDKEIEGIFPREENQKLAN